MAFFSIFQYTTCSFIRDFRVIEFCGIKDFKQIQWKYNLEVWGMFLKFSFIIICLSMFPEFGPEKQMKSENCRKLNLFPFALVLNEWECKYILEVLFMLFFHCSFLCSSGCEHRNSEKNRWNWKGKKIVGNNKST